MLHKPEVLTKYAQQYLIGALGKSSAAATAKPASAIVPLPVPLSLAAKPAVPAAGGHKEFTLDDVRAHNKKTDCWIIINDKVYDVTNFLAVRLPPLSLKYLRVLCLK